MPIPSNAVRKPRLVTFGFAAFVALCTGAGACKDPNPTFVFDSGTDGQKDAVSDGTGGADASGGGGTGGSGGTSGGA